LTARPLLLSRCRHCHNRYLPRPGPCPRCSSADLTPVSISPKGAVRASTAIEVPAAGWTPPHPLCLVELAEGTWVLAVGPIPTLPVGAEVAVERDEAIYRATPWTDGSTRALGRGEGDSPSAGPRQRSFEPPR